MEKTTTCIPCVPSILEGFRRGGTSLGFGGKGGCDAGDKNGTDDGRDSDDQDETAGRGEEYSLKSPSRPTTKVNTSATEQAIASNATAANGDLPSVTRLDSVGSNPSNKIHHLQKGKTSFGSGVRQDVIVEGPGVDDQHCYIINEGQVVTFYPLSVLNSVDGFRVTKPTKLYHGSVLCFGHSVYFRFNHSRQKSKTTQKIVIKGSSPDNEGRHRLIKLQSKPNAKEGNIAKSSYPVPDPSQLYWVDLDKELGLKPSAPPELKVSSSVGRVTETRSLSRPTVSNIRPVRNSLPSSSQSWDTRLSRSRFPNQGLEIYPKENSECKSPSTTFLPSPPPHLPHDSKSSGAKNIGKIPRPVIERKERRRLDDESDSGTHSTETASLSSSSHSSGIKVSLAEHVSLDPFVRDRNEPRRTELNVVPAKLRDSRISAESNCTSASAVTSSCSAVDSSVHLGRISGGYDNIANIRAAIIAAASAKLANSSPVAVEKCQQTIGRPKSLQVSIASPSDSSSDNALQTACLERSDALEPVTGSEKCTTDQTGEQSIRSLDVCGKGNLEDRPSASESRCKELFKGESSDCSVQPPDFNQQPTNSKEVFGEKPDSSVVNCTPVDDVSHNYEDVDATVTCNTDLDCISPASNITIKSGDVAGSVESSNSINDRKLSVEQSEDLSFFKAKSVTTKEKTSDNLASESPLAEEHARTNLVCFNKPPIGKSVPEKVVKTERKSTKPEKKSEPTAASLFKSLLSRSRSPSPKGRAGRSNSPSSAKELRAEHVSRPLRLQDETDESKTSNDPNDLVCNIGENVKTEETRVSQPDETNILEKLSSSESSENPWRVNLRQNLRPNLENFKGEKVFTKDTVTTNVFVGVGLGGSHVKGSSFSEDKTAKSTSGISDSAQDLRSLQSSEPQVHADVDFGYISDSGISVAKDSGRSAKFCRPKGKKNVTFAEECHTDSLAQENNRLQFSPEISPTMSQNMDRVVEGRSPVETTPVSESVRTYLEIVDSSWQKGKATDTSSKNHENKIKNQNGVCDFETDESKRLKSKAFNSDDPLGLSSEFDSNVERFDDGLIGGVDKRQSVSLDDLDLDNLGASQLDLKRLYEQQRAERVEEQRRAKVEKQRLEEILKMCSEFGVNTDLEKSEKCGQKSRVDLVKTLNSCSSNSEDDVERGTIKHRPILDRTIPVNSQMLELASSLNDGRGISTTASKKSAKDDISPISPILDSGIDMSTIDQPLAPLNSKESSLTFRNQRPLEEHHLHLVDRRPSDEFWSTSEYQPHHLASNAEYLSSSYSSKYVVQGACNDEKSKLDLLRELQRDVVRSIADVKQKISDIETRQSEAVREVEMERALLEGEQQIQMEQIDRIKEKIASLETKEANLLAEAKSQRAKEMEKILLEKEKLVDLERQLQATKDQASKNTNMDEAEALKKRCSEMQDAIDNHKFLVDNLEFQQLEVEAHFEEERESVQKELASERAYLDSLSNQHQATLEHITLQQTDLLKQVDFDVFELEKERQNLAELFQKENAILYGINCQIQDELSSSKAENDDRDEDAPLSHLNRWHRPRVCEAEAETVSRSSHESPQKLSTKFSHTIPKIDSRRIRPGGETHDGEDSRFLYEFGNRPASRPVWERSCDLPDGGVGDGGLVQWPGHGSAVPTTHSESEDSSISGSDPLSDKAMSLSSKEDQLHDMECLLVLAKAEGLRLVEEQMHQRDLEREALEQERRRRKELEHRLAEEIAKHNDVIEQAIRLREKEKLQARPLTRYLPVLDRSLDLQQFVVASGHSVDQCTHLTMTSTSCRGYLTKMGSRIRTWKKRWFVFDRTKRCLGYYGDKSESRPRGVIYFQAIEDVFVDHLHQVKSPTPQLTFCVKTYDRVYYLVAPSPDAMRIWIDVIFTGAEGYQQFA